MSNSNSTDNTYTRGIAAFVSGLRYEKIPADVRDRIKLLILDSLGCGIYGTLQEHSQLLIRALAKIDSSPASRIWGTNHKVSAPHAALANGSLIQGFELDDVHSRAIMHIGCSVLPALVAVTELRSDVTGKDFLTAAVAGFEIAPRVGLCVGQDFLAQGWHSGTKVVFSAVAAAASAMKLPEDKVVHAIGIAGTQASGLMAAQFGSMVKRMHAGRAAQSGLYGALLADVGYTGIANLFEADYGGFCTTFTRSNDRYNLAELTKGLGETFETMRVSLKFYSCAASNHATLDALRAIQAKHPFKADEVDSVVVHASHLVVEHVGWEYKPVGLTAAQMNLSFCVATLLLEGDVFVKQFTPEVVNDGRRMALAKKIKVVEDPAVTAKGRGSRYEVRVEVFLKNGARYEETVISATGSDKRFASEQDVVGKFRKLASAVLPQSQVDRLVESVTGLEKVGDASEIAKCLAAA